MAIDVDQLVLLAREQLTELPESVIFSRENLRALVPSAVALWQEQTNSNHEKRHAFLKESDDIDVEANVADIADAVDEYGFRLDFIRDSDVLVSYDSPIKLRTVFVSSIDRLRMPGRQDRFFVLAYLRGTQIEFCHPNFIEWSGTFRLRSVVIPFDLWEIPAPLAPELALVVAELARREFTQQNRGLNVEP